MPDAKITALTSIGTSTDPANDPLVLVDVSDTSMAASGTTKKVTLNQLLATSPTATLASATITGDLTVDTSTLKVDSANNRVGVNNASPTVALDIAGAAQTTGDITTQNGKFVTGSNGQTVGMLLNSFVPGASFDNYILNNSGNASTTASLNFGRLTSLLFGFIRTNNNSQNLQLGTTGTGSVEFFQNNSTAMTLNSTGLGVGTTPDNRLVVSTAAANDGIVLKQGSITVARFGIVNPGVSNVPYIGTVANNDFYFITNNVERMRLDSSGNVGIGVTPSAWGAGNKAIQVSTGAAFWGDAANAYINSNSFYNGTNFIYLTNAAANRYAAGGGVHYWYTAPSGTAGTAITFTQAMTLDASGNLGVGITNPSNRLHALVSSGADRDIFAAQVLSASNGLQIKWNHATTTLRVILANIPTSSAGLAAGTLWNDAGTIKIA